MSSEFYFIRHGQTDYNIGFETGVNKKVGGRSNHLNLNETGRLQARALGGALLKHGLIPDGVYCSPAVRTIQTAEISLQGSNYLDCMHIDNRLQELSQGAYEGKEFEEVFDEAEMARMDLMDKDHKLSGGESFREVGSRMRSFMAETSIKRPGQRIIVYTHGNAIKSLIGEVYDLGRRDIFAHKIGNTSLTKFVISEHGPELEYYGRILN